MASDNKDVVKQAEQFTPADEESSKSLSGLADQYFRELFSKAKIGGADDDAFKYGGDHQSGQRTERQKDGEPQQGEGSTVASSLQKLFDKAKNPAAGANKVICVHWSPLMVALRGSMLMLLVRLLLG
jgi:hypothetical protein